MGGDEAGSGGRFVADDGTELHYVRFGSGPPIYALQGGPSNPCSTIARDLEILSDRFTIVAHDYRGSGRSGSAPPDTYTLAQIAADVEALRKHLCDERMSLVSHSAGGSIALTYALTYPTRVEQLVLVSATPTTNLRLIAVPMLRALGVRRLIRVVEHVVRFLVLWSWKPPSRQRLEAMWAFSPILQEGQPGASERIALAYPEMTEPADNDTALMADIGQFDVVDRLASITLPVLAVCGALDALTLPGTQLLARHLPNCETHILHGVGHHPLLDTPEELTNTIRGFLTTG